MKIQYILPLLMLTACGSTTYVSNNSDPVIGPEVDKGPNNIDPAFQPLYNQFIVDAATYGMNVNVNQGITIRFQTLGQKTNLGEVIGDCEGVGYGNNTLDIDTTFWKSADAPTQQILLYHELGHCVLNEIHTTNSMAIMNALINMPQQYDATDLQGMIQQLFFDTGDSQR